MSFATLPGDTATEALTPEELRRRLERYLAAETGKEVHLGDFDLLTGGNAREMWAFNGTIGGTERHLLLRKDPPGGGPHAIRFQLERPQEYRAMQLAAEVGVPVAKVLWLIEDKAILGEAGFVMERLDGESIPRRILREGRYERARRRAAFQLGEILARMQAIDYAALDLPTPDRSVHPVHAQIEEYTEYLDELDDPKPGFALAMRWLRQNVPPRWDFGLVHGDFRNGNLMVNEEGIQAVLDWETVHIGDPMEDVGWLCVRSWRYGDTKRRAGGFGSLEDLLDGYEATSGKRPDPAVVHYWEVLGTLKWGILSSSKPTKRERQGVAGGVMAAAGRRLEGMAQSRRAAEMEFDVLRLLGGK